MHVVLYPVSCALASKAVCATPQTLIKQPFALRLMLGPLANKFSQMTKLFIYLFSYYLVGMPTVVAAFLSMNSKRLNGHHTFAYFC